MKVNNLGKYPLNLKYEYGDLEELSADELSEIKSLGVDEIWYWYSYGSYEGSGEILMRKGELYDTDSLSHCSCYGPIERLEFNGKPMDELKKTISTEYLNGELKDLFKAAEKSFEEA